jgi:hypothetical protein
MSPNHQHMVRPAFTFLGFGLRVGPGVSTFSVLQAGIWLYGVLPEASMPSLRSRDARQVRTLAKRKT